MEVWICACFCVMGDGIVILCPLVCTIKIFFYFNTNVIFNIYIYIKLYLQYLNFIYIIWHITSYNFNDDLRSSGTSIGAATFNSSKIIDNTASAAHRSCVHISLLQLADPSCPRSLLIYLHTFRCAVWPVKIKEKLIKEITRHYCDI